MLLACKLWNIYTIITYCRCKQHSTNNSWKTDVIISSVCCRSNSVLGKWKLMSCIVLYICSSCMGNIHRAYNYQYTISIKACMMICPSSEPQLNLQRPECIADEMYNDVMHTSDGSWCLDYSLWWKHTHRKKLMDAFRIIAMCRAGPLIKMKLSRVNEVLNWAKIIFRRTSVNAVLHGVIRRLCIYKIFFAITLSSKLCAYRDRIMLKCCLSIDSRNFTMEWIMDYILCQQLNSIHSKNI